MEHTGVARHVNNTHLGCLSASPPPSHSVLPAILPLEVAPAVLLPSSSHPTVYVIPAILVHRKKLLSPSKAPTLWR